MNGEGHPLNQQQEKEAQRVAYLISGYLRQTLSDKEHDELDAWMTASDANQQLFEQLTDPDVIEQGLAEMDSIDTEAALERVKAKIDFNSPTVKKRFRIAPMWAAAACVVALVGIWLLNVRRETGDLRGDRETSDVRRELEPGRDRAWLKLENGRVIDLSKLKNGDTSFSHVISMVDGLIEYKAGAVQSPAIHTLTTPVGGQYQVILSDGTKVWLNSSSKLKYPVVFGDSARVVELEGEGYFEVSQVSGIRYEGSRFRGQRSGVGSQQLAVGSGQGRPPSSKGEHRIPFIVKADKMEVEVLGTHFNVSTYGNAGEVVLLEGKVRVGSRETSDVRSETGEALRQAQGDGRELLPGQKGVLMESGKWKVESGVDTSVVVAWKNGKFQFKEADIETIMAQVARWYDAKVVYEGKKTTYHFNATIYRNEPLEKLLSLLEETGRVRFVVKGRRIVVKA